MNTEIISVIKKISEMKNITEKNIEKSRDFADYILSAMVEIGVSELMGGKYSIRTIKASAGSDTSLYIKSYDENGVDYEGYSMLNYNSIDSERSVTYLYGDYSAGFNMPNREDIFTFSADALELLNEISKLGNESINFPTIKKTA